MMTPLIFIFSFFAIAAILSSLCVISVKNPVHAVLFLVLTFVATAGIWMLLEAEFLSLILILVYVGAVMTLFLFVVMMMNLQHLPKYTWKRYLPLALILGLCLLVMILMTIAPAHFPFVKQAALQAPNDYSNVTAIAEVLYTDYIYVFELSAVILLVSIIAAISLAFRGKQVNTKQQKIEKQIATQRKDSVKLVRINNKGANG